MGSCEFIFLNMTYLFWLTYNATLRIHAPHRFHSSHGTSARCRPVQHRPRQTWLRRLSITLPSTLTNQQLHRIHRFHLCLLHFLCRLAPQRLFSELAVLGTNGLKARRGSSSTSLGAHVQGVHRNPIIEWTRGRLFLLSCDYSLRSYPSLLSLAHWSLFFS